MEHFRLYLRAELGKLRDPGDAAAFFAASRCRPARSVDAVVGMFAAQALVDAYVGALSDDALVELADCCETWRGNGVATRLRAGRLLGVSEVPTSAILLRQAEPELGSAFAREGWRLDAIAHAPDLMAADPYRRRTAGESVAFRTCLSNPANGGLYRLFDGMHRAIQMARNGEPTISVAVIGP
jgi:hypothetical protein